MDYAIKDLSTGVFREVDRYDMADCLREMFTGAPEPVMHLIEGVIEAIENHNAVPFPEVLAYLNLRITKEG